MRWTDQSRVSETVFIHLESHEYHRVFAGSMFSVVKSSGFLYPGEMGTLGLAVQYRRREIIAAEEATSWQF